MPDSGRPLQACSRSMACWLTIEVQHGGIPADGWRRGHGEPLIEAAVTNGARDWTWNTPRWGVILELKFRDEQARNAFRTAIGRGRARRGARPRSSVCSCIRDGDPWSLDRSGGRPREPGFGVFRAAGSDSPRILRSVPGRGSKGVKAHGLLRGLGHCIAGDRAGGRHRQGCFSPAISWPRVRRRARIVCGGAAGCGSWVGVVATDESASSRKRCESLAGSI